MKQQLIDDLVAAWIDPGKHPTYHYQQISNLATQWPVLYQAIAKIVKEERA